MFLMLLRPPRSTCTYTLFPYTTLCRSAEVVLTRSDVAKGHPDYYQDLAERIARDTPGAYFINQFGNPDNPAAHEFGTGPEIPRQMAAVGGLDAVVLGRGSPGPQSGIGRAARREGGCTSWYIPVVAVSIK